MAAAIEGVEVTSDTMLKAFYSPNSSPPHPLLGGQVPLTAFDMANYNCHVAVLYAFRSPLPDNVAMRESLAKALSHFPLLAGRFVPDKNGRPYVILNNAGIRLKEAAAPTTLEEHLPLDPSSNLGNLHPHPAEGVEVLLQIQLTRFLCGGLVLGLTTNHRVADGGSMCHFLFTWAKFARGLDVIDVLPYFDRRAVLAPRDPPRCEFDYLGVVLKHKAPPRSAAVDVGAFLQKTRTLGVHFSVDFISKLKHKVTGGDQGRRRASTFLCVLTHTWKKVTLARGLPNGEATRVRLAVNGRQRLKPPIPTEYFGNLVLWAFPTLTAGELVRGSYAHVAQVIQDAVDKVDDAYFKSFIDFGASVLNSAGEKGMELDSTLPEVGEFLNPDLEFNSWLGLQFHELDFGGGSPCAFLPPGLPVEGLTILMPSCREEGGFDVYMTLKEEHAAVFQQVCYSLD